MDQGPDIVIPLLYAAKKYCVTNLETKCREYLENEICVDNVCVILEHSSILNEHTIRAKCFEYVLENADNVLKSEGFISLSKATVEELISCDDLICEELGVFNACIQWAKKRCEEKHMNSSEDKNLRQELGSILGLIRFPLMGIEVFAEKVSDTSILTADEIIALFQDFVLKLRHSKFNNKMRRSSEIVFSQKEHDVGTLTHTGTEIDCFSFKVSKTCKLIAIGQYLPVNEGVVKGQVEIYKDESLEQTINISLTHSTDSIETYVRLDKAFPLSPESVYTLRGKLNGQGTYQGHKGKTTMNSDGLDITFMLPKTSHFQGNCLSTGQFPGIVVRSC